MQLMRPQQCGAVNVEMDCASSVDMSKVEVLQNQITTSTTEVKTSQSQVTDLKRTFQSLEIELHGLLTQKGYLEQSVTDINGRYGSQLSQLQVHINSMEEELQQLNVSIQQQASEYQILLDIKMRLEMEIAEYSRLLDGEGLSYYGSDSTSLTLEDKPLSAISRLAEVYRWDNSLVSSSVASTGTIYSNGSWLHSSAGSGGLRSNLPDRLQIVKPLEGEE
ncbi:keratin, type I cytoskeletal 19-like [Coregonus clupeaformis]|uniref:keratin, type I cytoskeletal 19-like n=1 Tax=Coregonus clupeaformis TaxID=59861 RepID=UPI001E1C881C|nr:keratin, type I cytoskeletal 19-like [Coregonus clupeaformis]